MAKQKVKLQVRLPPYPTPKAGSRLTARTPGLAWRRQVYGAIMKAASVQGVKRLEGTEVDAELVIYLDPESQLRFHDIDNLLKHVFDALQGRLAGVGRGQPLNQALLPNDHQIRRVIVEKRPPSKATQSSRLVVRDYAKTTRTRSRQQVDRRRMVPETK